MCCVLGYVGGPHCRMHILEGLARLEYRGYDSAGYACYRSDLRDLAACKVVGGVLKLVEKVRSLPAQEFIGIGHTRWATNGLVTEENAHPIFDCTQTCAVVHNGIIENEHALRQELITAGHTFRSQTDTEIIAHLIEDGIAQDIAEPHKIMHYVVNKLHGAYAFIALSKLWPNTLLVGRRRSPLCIMRGPEGLFVASDPIACAGKANAVVFLPDESYAVITGDAYALYRFDGTLLELPEESLSLVWESSGKQGYEHYMLKEIYEQKAVLKKVVEEAGPLLASWIQTGAGKSYALAQHVIFTGCGTSWYAAQIAHHFRESLVGLGGIAMAASELRDRPILAPKGSWVCALSQSGETADTLEALRYVHEHDITSIAVTNRATSTMAREAHHSFMLHAGHEIAVASSKTLAAHVGIFYLLAQACAMVRHGFSQDYYGTACNDLMHAADMLQEALERNVASIDREIAPLLAQQRIALTMGRGLGVFVAQEAALKLKELAYIFVEAYLAGELKHGPLALIESGVLVIACSTLEERPYHKLLASVHEVHAREGHVIALAFDGQQELADAAQTILWIPRPRNVCLGPLVMLGVVQYLAYRVAYELGRPIDKPRNLAKSVTVE